MSNGHLEGIRSARDTFSGTSVAGLLSVAYAILGKPYLESKGISLTFDQEATVIVGITASLTGISSYIHGFMRGRKRK
jgi:hypothetical protein